MTEKNSSLARGLWAGFAWTYGGDGSSSKTSAAIAAYHHPRSLTWRWAIYWSKPEGFRPALVWHRTPSGYNRYGLVLPLLGSLLLFTQPHMWRDG